MEKQMPKKLGSHWSEVHMPEGVQGGYNKDFKRG